jgi:hypothetical protein
VGRREFITGSAAFRGGSKFANKVPLYQTYGKSENRKIELFDGAQEDLPAMRWEILAWIDQYLVSPVVAP